MAKRTTRTNTKARTEPVVTDQAADMGVADTRAVSMGSEPSEEEIRIRAYRRYLNRGGADGRDFDDWLEAERELKKLA